MGVGICYKLGNGARKHWLQRHGYCAAAKMWLSFKKMEWQSKWESNQRLRAQRQQQRQHARQQVQQLQQLQQMQQMQQRQAGVNSSPAPPPPQQQQQTQQQQPQPQQYRQQYQQQPATNTRPHPSAPAPAPAYTAPAAAAAPAGPGAAPPDFLNFLGAMQDQMAEYDRAYGLPAGTGLQLLQQQQQQQQQQQGLYPKIDGEGEQVGTAT